MKLHLTWLFLMASLYSFAQNHHTRFIECRKIKWASEVIDTIRLSEVNLSLKFRQALLDRKIKVSLAEENFNPGEKKYAEAETVRQRIAPNRVMETIDVQGNITGSMMEATDPLFDEKYFDTLTNNLLEATRIIYIKNGRLLTYTPWVSVKTNVYTSWGEKLGISNAFNTAFNSSNKNQKSQSRNAIYLGQTIHKWDLPGSRSKMLKQLYEQNLLEALWPHLQNKIYRFQDLTRSKPINLHDINYSLIDSRIISVPAYNNMGTPIEQVLPFPSLSIADILSIDLIEDWYFNQKKQMVFSSIKKITLYARIWRNGVQDAASSPILNIVVD